MWCFAGKMWCIAGKTQHVSISIDAADVSVTVQFSNTIIQIIHLLCLYWTLQARSLGSVISEHVNKHVRNNCNNTKFAFVPFFFLFLFKFNEKPQSSVLHLSLISCALALPFVRDLKNNVTVPSYLLLILFSVLHECASGQFFFH